MELPKTPSLRLDGKTALVTGASSGIGLACAVALAEAGAEVTAAARSEDKLDTLVEAAQEKGLKMQACALDVSDLDAVSEMLDKCSSFDILVNSAGMARHGPAAETRADDFDAVMDVNLRGAYFLSQMVARKMIAAETGGSIINISSQMAHVGGLSDLFIVRQNLLLRDLPRRWPLNGVRIRSGSTQSAQLSCAQL